MAIKLHPFDPAINKPRPNADGSVSTEITRTVQLPNGAWANVPSLWWGDGGQVRDFGSMSDDQLAGLASRYEVGSGTQFPRYSSLWAAEGSARTRSEAGGGTQGKITGATPMPNGFNQMGGTPEGYGQLLNSARQQLVRLPDGTLTLAPQFGQATSLEEIYGGILPPPVPSTPLVSRSVSTVPVDMNGNPIITSSTGPGFSAPSAGATMAEQRSGARPAITVGSQPAGTVQMPPGARPSNIPPMNLPPMGPPPVQTAAAPIPRPRPLGAPVWDPFGTNVAKDESRLPTNDGGEAGFMAAFYPDAANPAVDAAGQMAGGVPMPRARPIPPASIPLTSLTGAPPSIPMPLRARPQTPYMTSPSYMTTPGSPYAAPSGTLGPITFRKGDTVSQLARDRGMTVKSFADLFGIKDPNRIYAGQTVVPSVPVPRTRPPSLGGGSTSPRNSGRWEGVLDEFGMIL